MTQTLGRGVFRRLPVPFALLTDLITLQVNSSTADGQGGFLDSWTNLAQGVNVRALVVDDKGRKRNLGGQEMQLGMLAEHVTHHVYLRSDVPGLVPGCRALWGSVYLRIHNVDHLGGNPILFCEEVRG